MTPNHEMPSPPRHPDNYHHTLQTYQTNMHQASLQGEPLTAAYWAVRITEHIRENHPQNT